MYREPARGLGDDKRAAEVRVKHQHSWVDLQIRQAMQRGAFDDLPGLGKPLPGLADGYDPQWWIKELIAREKITGVLPPALQIRKTEAQLDEQLDLLRQRSAVEEAVCEFNAAVMRARFQPLGGPPMITMPRDVSVEVARWEARRLARRATREAVEPTRDNGPNRALRRGPSRWWRRLKNR